MTFKIIYTNGDSFAAGDELAYAQFYPDFSQLFRQNETLPDKKKLVKKWGEAMAKDWDKYRKFEETCREMSYTAKLGNLLNLPWMNMAKGGRSNQEMIGLTIEYLERRLLRIYKPEEILVVLGITNFERFMIPSEQSITGTASLIVGYPAQDSDNVYNYYLSNFNENYAMIDNVVSFLGGLQYLTSKGISFLLVDNLMYSRSKVIYINKLNNPMIHLLPKEDLIMGEYVSRTEPETHICGHFAEPVHERVANELAKIAKERFADKF